MVQLMSHWSISSDIITEEAEKLGLEVEIIAKNKNTFFIKGNWKEILFKSTDFGGNSSLGIKISNDKELTYRLLERHNLPIAKTIYITKGGLENFTQNSLESISFPVIIKPIDEWHGNGVMMNITSFSELKNKLSLSFERYEKMIIQEQIDGDEIRVLIVKDAFLVAKNRTPAHVIWDGTKTIKELINFENSSNPYRSEQYNTPLSYIQIDKELLGFISKNNLTLESIPSKNEKIQLRGNSNIGSGGITVDVTDDLCEDIKNTCKQACKILNLEICWVDILTRDITKPLSETGGIILEMNATPGIGSDREFTSVNTGKEILKLLFFTK